MNEEKRNRIIGAVTVNAVILIIIIIVILVCQIVDICVLSARKKELLQEYYSLQQQLEQSKDELERLQLDEELQITYRKLAELDPDFVKSITGEDDGD